MELILKHLKYKELFFTLISRDIKLKYRRSILGYFWTILNPLLTMTVMTIVFSNMFRFNIPNYPVYLIIGSLLFGYMQGSTQRALNSIIDNASLIKKTYVPKYIFTMSVVTSEFINLMFALLALLLVVLVTGVHFTLNFLLIIIPLVELYIFCLGLGLFLAQAAVFFRDIQYIWSVLCTAWLYLSAIFYPIQLLPPNLKWIIEKFNPLYGFITIFRGCILSGSITVKAEYFLHNGIISIVVLILGAWIFSLNRYKFILRI
ncbi:MAG: ABC transporter permease [Spirochaetaceae bacterium]|nr:ABC transporter permease [Spirochaetaceae bacterium]